MARVIAISNQKGGVGKTTSAINIAASLAVLKYRVLLIDLDPQGNATMGCGIDKREVPASICEVLLGEKTLSQIRLKADPGDFDVVPANQDLTAAEVALLSQGAGRESTLKRAIAPILHEYDVILIDCPPSLNIVTLNALVASHSVLIPMQCEYYAMEGLSALLATVEEVKQTVNPQLELEGILRTMHDPRNNLANEVSSQLMEHFNDKVFKSIVPRNVRLAEAPSFGKPALYHDKESRGAMAYLALASELKRNWNSPNNQNSEGLA
jgi:chromosome partitioning protein